MNKLSVSVIGGLLALALALGGCAAEETEEENVEETSSAMCSRSSYRTESEYHLCVQAAVKRSTSGVESATRTEQKRAEVTRAVVSQMPY